MAAPVFNLNHSKIHTQPLRFTWICKGQIKGSLLKGKKIKQGRVKETDTLPGLSLNMAYPCLSVHASAFLPIGVLKQLLAHIPQEAGNVLPGAQELL